MCRHFESDRNDKYRMTLCQHPPRLTILTTSQQKSSFEQFGRIEEDYYAILIVA